MALAPLDGVSLLRVGSVMVAKSCPEETQDRSLLLPKEISLTWTSSVFLPLSKHILYNRKANITPNARFPNVIAPLLIHCSNKCAITGQIFFQGRQSWNEMRHMNYLAMPFVALRVKYLAT
jgi:hypothetical protein